jgi:hypothetical protein
MHPFHNGTIRAIHPAKALELFAFATHPHRPAWPGISARDFSETTYYPNYINLTSFKFSIIRR